MSEILQVEEFLRYMLGVAKCERALGELNFAWRLIESTAKMTCPTEAKTILPIMKSTREGFNRLEKQLIANLVNENIAKSVQEIHFKAQVIIDIVVRNLFERTADVGFLAMDDAICEFILNGANDTRNMVSRLQQYRDKYTVYDEILILDTEGKVLAHLDANNKVSHSCDPLIMETLASNGYVETFRKSDLRPMLERSLIYSRTIVHPQTSDPIGVLCLCFLFEDEMKGVFSGLRKEEDYSVMLMLDKEGRVIASNDTDHIPIGKILPFASKGAYEIVSYSGREYLAKTCGANNYQGYYGPGWFGHVMIPCETAFRQSRKKVLSSYDAAMMQGVMGHAQTFCPPLYDVIMKAEAINVALGRVVWNGQIMSSRQRGDLLKLKSILQEISQTGDETRKVFSDSIHDLYTTVISTNLQDTQFISRLMIDIMDRNLYERANDCRWWALSPDIRRLMVNQTHTKADVQRITQILEAINALYTAYTRILVFDTTGKIIAASDLHKDGLEVLGHSMSEEIVSQVLSLHSSQDYCVSSFVPTWLYSDRPTYIYCAAIRHSTDAKRIIGGIGIVFDSEKEFETILRSALPTRSGAFGVFVDRVGNVISSTEPVLRPGCTFLPNAAGMFTQQNGESDAKIIVHDSHYMITGYTTSFGYREYKNSGDYQNDIIAMVFVPIGVETEDNVNQTSSGWSNWREHIIGEDTCEFATFFLGPWMYGLPVSIVIEAVEATRITPTSTLKPLIVGMLNFHNENDATDLVIPVVDLSYLLNPGVEHGVLSQVIVVQQDTHTLGLLVGDLHDVLEFNSTMIEPAPRLYNNDINYISNLIKTTNNNKMIQVVEIDNILRKVFRSI